MTEFDQFSKNYESLLDRSVALSGETSHYFADYKARYTAAMGVSKDSGKILDFGCGVGLLSAALKRHLPNFIQHGYDVSPASIGMVDATLAQSGRFTSELSRLDYDYDAIVMACVLHHIPVVKRSAVFREMVERLSANGQLLVFEHNPANPVTRWVVNHCPFDRDAILLTPADVIECLRDAGLRFVRRDYIVFFPSLFSWFRPLERFLGWCPGGAQYAIVAAKDPSIDSIRLKR